MHDILEGALPFEMKELIRYLVRNSVVTLEDVNEAIVSFCYTGADARNKPAPISQTTLSSSDHALKQTGMSIRPLVFTFIYACIVCPFSNRNVVPCQITSSDDWRAS